MNLLGLNKEQLLALDPKDVLWPLYAEEIFHLWAELNGSWFYDYQALEEGRPGLHAELKSKRCSDGFFMSRAVLQYSNLRKLIANQMVMKLEEFHSTFARPNIVCGIPDGAKELGDNIAQILGLPVCEMVKDKETGKLRLITEVRPGLVVLQVEDFCTRGTAFKEGTKLILDSQPQALIFPYEIAILNRGGLSSIEACGMTYGIGSLVDKQVNDWDPAECPLCKRGSKRIKPKATEENWRLITTSQLKVA